ncbi:MAG: hypothetical protein RLZZ28_1977 [Bacteroidota bacterium]
MNAFTIKDLENLSGIKAHTIRIWEQRYGFLTPGRTDTNIRYYSNDELQKILNIALLNKYGFKISHIDKMSADEMSEKILSLAQTSAQQERIVHELINCMSRMQMDEFEEVIDRYIKLKGVEKTILQIIFPFLERIGILWLTKHINPAQEHLVTNIIRQKLIVGIDQAKSTLSSKKLLLLFLPEGEHHELGLLFIHYLLKKRGIRVLYLGANVPMKDVAFVAELVKPDYLFAHLTSLTANFSFDKFLLNLQHTMPASHFIISGMITQSFPKKAPLHVQFKKSLGEVMDCINAL